MADSNITDVSKMKVIEKSRGLPSMENSVLGHPHSNYFYLAYSDESVEEIEVLDEDYKSHHDLSDESINEELAMAEQLPTPLAPAPEQTATDLKPVTEVKPQRKLRRNIAMSKSAKDKSADGNTEAVAKKIVLNRSRMTTAQAVVKSGDNTATKNFKVEDSVKIKITASMNAKTRLELRAKRFGLPVKMSDIERKEARKRRFGQNKADDNLDKLKKRAERFG